VLRAELPSASFAALVLTLVSSLATALVLAHRLAF